MSYQYPQYGRGSEDSSRPLSDVRYQQTYQSDNAYQSDKYGYGAGYSAAANPTKRKRHWIWWLLAVIAIVVILGAVLGGVFGSRAAKDDHESSTASDNTDSSGPSTGLASKTAGSLNGAIIPTATDAWGNPLYPTTTGSARISSPSVIANDSLSCGSDNFTASSSGSYAVRPDHPVLIAPTYKWECLPKLIANDGYMAYWNNTIFSNATVFYDAEPVNYTIDGCLSCSGVLDVARQVQLRIKHWGYAWKLSGDTKWVERTWRELQVASGNTSQPYGTAGNNWNTAHFLDLAEFTAAFGLAYDWFYDAWTAEQKSAIMWSILELGIKYGLQVYEDPNGAAANFNWWSNNIKGNWNCVCNSGLILGALAISNDDPTGAAQRMLQYAVPNIGENCAFAPSPDDGTWAETANYWYFGTTGHVQAAAALLSATGSDHNLLEANPGMKLSALYHMYVTGMQGLFAYGDTGPNKYTATANGLMFYGSQYNIPMYTLFQRDRGDAPEPMSMLYYDPQVTGDFWDGLALDHYFSNTSDGWASMRTSWTSTEGMYIAMKAGALLNHQTHGDLDVGDFVLDALGQRWAGELGSADYLGDGYFSSELQNSERWLYYRTRTEGQNTVLLNELNQNVSTVPTTTYDTTGDSQDALVYTPNNSSTAYFTADMSTAYGTSAKRAIRFLNGRNQVLLQDEITVPSSGNLQWRMHTNATVSMSNGNRTATLSLGGQTLVAELLEPAGATFYTQAAVRLSTDPALPSDALSQDQSNGKAVVLTIGLGAGEQNIQVLFNPQWPNFKASDYMTPPSVAIDSWSLTSHN